MPFSAVAVTVFLLLPFFSNASATYHRRILHQPFVPEDDFPPPSQPPDPSPANYPFSSSAPNLHNYPFFPANPSSPPPPPPPLFAPSSFASNVSSDAVSGGGSRRDSTSPKLISAAIAAVVAAVIVVSLAVFIHLRKPPGNPNRPSFSQSKSPRSNENGGSSAENSRHFPKLRTSAPTSAEFLYLGTLASSGAVRCSPGPSNYSPAVDSGSPELRPLPPLKTQQDFWQNFADAVTRIENGGSKEFFYSPMSSENGGNSDRSPPVGVSAVPGKIPAPETGYFHESASLSSPSSSLDRSSRRSHESSPTISSFPEHSLEEESSPAVKNVAISPPYFTVSRSPEINPINEHKSSPPRISITAITVAPMPPSRSPPPPPPPPPPIKSRSTPNSPPNNADPPQITPPLNPISVQIPPSIPSLESEPDIHFQTPKEEDLESPPKPKLKQLHWDKVPASSDRKMVWDQLRTSSFKLDEEMIQTLFVVNTPKPRPKEATRWQLLPSPNRDTNSSANRVLDPKKSQNIAILLKALHVTVDEVCEGLLEGNTEVLGAELLESLLKMAPTNEEEQKLKEHEDDSPVKLGAAEKFLKEVVSIPFAFKRIEILLYISNFDSEVEYLKKSFAALEAACEALRSSRMFLKLLDAVLKTGNRMNVGTNRGDAQAFKLDTLLKLVDVKGADGKTTLLHFVVQEIIRSEGGAIGSSPASSVDAAKSQKLRLQVVSTLSLELSNVRKAAVMDADCLSRDVSKLSQGLKAVRECGKLGQTASPKFNQSIEGFIAMAEREIVEIQARERSAMAMVKEMTEYFHGDSAKEEAHPLRIFMVVRDFLTILDRVCEEVGSINDRTMVSSPYRFPVPVNPTLRQADS